MKPVSMKQELSRVQICTHFRERRRKDTDPVVLQIRARDAFGEGIKFRKCGSVYIAKQIPGKFIKQD